MFGLEKKGRKPFEFDLEKEIKKSSKKKEELLKHIESRTGELKKALREGKASENFDQFGLLLQAYASLHKVLEKAAKK